MKEDAFSSWLSNCYRTTNGTLLDARTVCSRVGNCRTVEKYEGDLDHYFDQDHLRGLLDRLKYSTEDERRNNNARHRIPIDGNIRNGSETLRSGISLYKQFRESWAEGTLNIQQTAHRSRIQEASPASRPAERRIWPTWEQPDHDEILAMAHLIVPFIRFLVPEVIQAVVEDNQRHRAGWIEDLQARRINPLAYLWENSPCAFPGVRRYAGSREIAAHRGHARLDENLSLNALVLDDNDYPKQLWSFVFRGVRFSKFGPKDYALAHLADHKDHGNRFGQDFEVIEDRNGAQPLFGLYTCPSNTVYTPVRLIKPTDFAGSIRALLVRRSQQLYGAFCKILPPYLRIPETFSPEWNVSEFKWADPVGTTKHIQSFLEFRRDKMANLIDAISTQQIDRENS